MSQRKPTYKELEKRLAAAEPIVEALERQEVDAVVGEDKITFLLLRGVGEALQESDAGFRAMFELPGIGMVQADSPSFRFTRVNEAFCEMMGYSAEELMALNLIGLTHPEDRPKAMQDLARVLRGKTDAWSLEKRCIRKDGSVIWVVVNGAALRDDMGRVVRFAAMIRDLSAEKQTAQTLREQALQLRKLTAELKGLKKMAAGKAGKAT